MGLTQLIYTSTAVCDMKLADLEAIMTVAQERNAEFDITGLLVYFNRTREFIQLLEGEEKSILELYNRCIRNDIRHRDVETYYVEYADERVCRDWSMSFRIDENSSLQDRLQVSEFVNGASPGTGKMEMPLLVMAGYRDMMVRGGGA